MCLTVKDKKVRIAENDIVCYKIVIERISPSPILATYFMSSEIKLGKLYRKKGDKFRFYKSYEDNFFIEEGGYHVFAKLNDAVDYFSEDEVDKKKLLTREGTCFSPLGYSRAKVIKAIIPKGTPYVVGEFRCTRSVAWDNWTFETKTSESICTKAVIYKELDED